MQFWQKMTILRSIYWWHRNLFAVFFQYTSLIHVCYQISTETDTSDLWRSEILIKKEVTFLKRLVAKFGVQLKICCLFQALYLRAPKVWHRYLFAGFFQYTSLIYIFDQISKETDTSDLWRSEI